MSLCGSCVREDIGFAIIFFIKLCYSIIPLNNNYNKEITPQHVCVVGIKISLSQNFLKAKLVLYVLHSAYYTHIMCIAAADQKNAPYSV